MKSNDQWMNVSSEDSLVERCKRYNALLLSEDAVPIKNPRHVVAGG